MNHEIHGKTLPHLHLHLFPREPGDPYVGETHRSQAAGFRRSELDIKRLRSAVVEALRPDEDLAP